MQITPSIHALRHSFKIPINHGVVIESFVYTYIIFGEMITLIDSDVAGCEKTLFEYIRSTGGDPSDITLMILTHSHPDHIRAAAAIQQLTGCSVAAHPAERSWIEDVALQNRERPVPGFATLVGGSVHIDNELEEGDLIEPDDTRAREMQVFYTPGHSAGSIESPSCTGKGLSSPVMQFLLQETCRSMMMPFYRDIGKKTQSVTGHPGPAFIVGRAPKLV